MKRRVLFLLLILFLSLPPFPVQAQSGSSCSFQPDGSIVCVTTGGGSGGSGNNNGNGNGNGGGSGNGPIIPATPPPTCTLGAMHQQTVYKPEPSLGAGQCSVWNNMVTDCTGETMFGSNTGTAPCPEQQAAQPQPPCTTFTVSAGGITCANSDWNLRARVPFPEIFLDVRPYPATLVRWPTALRNEGLSDASGSDSVGYIPYGGGSPGNPQAGDWKDLRLTLTLRAIGVLQVSLPNIEPLILQGSGTPTIIQWEVPSHPAVGGGPLAGSIAGLEELPADIPVFVGEGRAPYLLFWELRYDEYVAVSECVAGPDKTGSFDCKRKTGHMEVTGYEWRRRSSGGQIQPDEVQGLPASVKADLNGDGVPDAYWDRNLTLRRMDDADSVNNPQYQQSWNWGGTIYWAVREGQGQIGWPGAP